MQDDFLNIDNLSLSQFSEDTEFIPLVTNEDDQPMQQGDVPEDLPIITLRNTVIFPGVATPITAGRDKSIKLIKDVQNGNKLVGVVSQKNHLEEDPEPADVYRVGTLARIVRSFKMPDGNITVIIQGQNRIKVREFTATEPYLKANVELMAETKPVAGDNEFDGIIESIKELALRIIQESPNIPSEAQFAIKNIESNNFLLNFISSNMNLDVKGKMELLVENNLKKRATLVLKHLNREMQMLEVKNEIQSKVKVEFDQQQREYFLHQQMKTIQEELGGTSHEGEIEAMRQRAKKMKWAKEVKEHFEKEVAKLQRLNPQMPEFSIQRNYLELMLDLPWKKTSKDNFDLNRAQRILDRDHFGLEKVKERIIEHLAVLKLKGDMKSPILCLYGPPGVGKTSLGKSVAEALNRKYVRMSLGGLRDEAEIRGHRKTYIGAMPGRVVQNIKKAGTGNPVFVLDEIDKLSYGGHGDPSSAMLEVLDPEQNNEFYDNYLELGYDLSRVMFIATANNLQNIQPALRDRMEIIEVNGYTLEEKVEIARQHLLPKQLAEHGLGKEDFKLRKAVIELIVEGYTRESGVRTLDKTLAKVVRYAARHKAMDEAYDLNPDKEKVLEILGPPRFEKELYQDDETAGVVTGLAWTPVGGDILYIETSLSHGSGKTLVTGNLGDVMKESAQIAMAYLKANADSLDIDPKVFKNWDVNIHVPEGATPKDGPSAGVTMLTALASLFTQRRVRSKIAMTGEITLRGRVLPVGGIKEKILAAKRAKITDIILSERNRKDIEEIQPHYLKGLTFYYVERMQEVLELALLKQKVKNPKDLLVHLN